MISNYRRKIGLSQVECEREIGVSHSTWSDWETGKRLPTVGMCRRLAMLLRVDLETLIRACHPEVIKVMEIIEAKRRGQAA
jgi:transcriptional regulator with XRE-family HTH domain